jgi:hypothetical protein
VKFLGAPPALRARGAVRHLQRQTVLSPHTWLIGFSHGPSCWRRAPLDALELWLAQLLRANQQKQQKHGPAMRRSFYKILLVLGRLRRVLLTINRIKEAVNSAGTGKVKSDLQSCI